MTDQNEQPFEAQASDNTADNSGVDVHAVIDALQTQIEELQKQLDQAKADKLIALADAENASKRADRRIADNAKYATSNICKTLLQVADNLGRALLAAPAEQRAANEPLKNLAMGVELTEKELLKVLEDQGVKRIDALNAPFDPNLHNAVQEQENASVPSGTVLQVFVDGYTMHDRLLRPAMVVVSRGGPKRDASAAQASGGAQSGVNTSV
jgi:molecular chaperone GrpE